MKKLFLSERPQHALSCGSKSKATTDSDSRIPLDVRTRAYLLLLNDSEDNEATAPTPPPAPKSNCPPQILVDPALRESLSEVNRAPCSSSHHTSLSSSRVSPLQGPVSATCPIIYILTNSEDDEAAASILPPTSKLNRPLQIPVDPAPEESLSDVNRAPRSSSHHTSLSPSRLSPDPVSYNVMDIFTDDKDEETDVSTSSALTSNNPHPDLTCEGSHIHRETRDVAEPVVTSALDPSLAEIQPEESELKLSGTSLVVYLLVKGHLFHRF